MQRSSWDAIKPLVMQPDLSVLAEITFLVLIALQYLGYIVANVKEKAKVITFKTICQHCNFNTITRTQTRVLTWATLYRQRLQTQNDDGGIILLVKFQQSNFKHNMFYCSYFMKDIY